MLRVAKCSTFASSGAGALKVPQCTAATAKPAEKNAGPWWAHFSAKDATPLQKWRYQTKFKYRIYGLLKDDLIVDSLPVTKEAIRRLPAAERAARDKRMKIALDCSVKQTPLPPELWVKHNEDKPYLTPLVNEVLREFNLKSSYRLETPPLAKVVEGSVAKAVEKVKGKATVDRTKQLLEDKQSGKQLNVADQLALVAHQSQQAAQTSGSEAALRLAQLAAQAHAQFSLSPQEQVARQQLTEFTKELELLSKQA